MKLIPYTLPRSPFWPVMLPSGAFLGATAPLLTPNSVPCWQAQLHACTLTVRPTRTLAVQPPPTQAPAAPGSRQPAAPAGDHGSAPEWTPPPPAASASAIEADAIFDPDSDPSTHTLPASFTAGDAHPRSTAFEADPPSFSHDPTQAPDPTSSSRAAHQAFLDPEADPLDPESIARLLADASIYERMYEEYGMGGDDDPGPEGGMHAEAGTGVDSEEDEEEGTEEEMDEDVRRRSGIILELASMPLATPAACLLCCRRRKVGVGVGRAVLAPHSRACVCARRWVTRLGAVAASRSGRPCVRDTC